MPDEVVVPPVKVEAPDHAAENASLKARILEMEAKFKAIPNPEPDLLVKAKDDRDALDKDRGKIKRLESSITFNMRSPEFLKANASLLPKETSDLFAAAEKETYNDATEKADAIKSGLIQSFFQVQANVDLLTPGQKAALDEFLNLTKTGKQDKAQSTYEMIFEPAFEMLKRVKRAEALRGGHSGSDADDAYKKKLMAGSAKHYRMEKK